MSNKSIKSLVTKGLITNIDISNVNSWNLNSSLTVGSLSQWDRSISKSQIINDFGLTAIDNGRTDNPYNKLQLDEGDKTLSLYRVGEYNPNGIDYTNYEMSGITDSSIGNYFKLNGGYLQGFFKLHEYDYEVLPFRYGNGITLETLIQVDESTTGILFYMGARSEDKYNPFYDGEVNRTVSTIETEIRRGVINQLFKKTETLITYSGVTTSEGNYLHSIKYEDQQKKAIINLDNPTESVEIFENSNSIGSNVIAVGIDNQKRLFYRYVNENGITRDLTTIKTITTTGWTTISFIYKPNILVDEDNPTCLKRRVGDILFYVNGRLFEKIENVDEFYFSKILNTRDKQVGVPYNISWGGGSEGLKNSYHFDPLLVDLYTGSTQQSINENFTILSGVTNQTSDLILLNNNSSFSENVIEVKPISGMTFNEKYLIRLNTLIDVAPNKDYKFSVSINDSGIFLSNESEIKLVLLGEDKKIIKTYGLYTPHSKMSDDIINYKEGLNEWHVLSKKIILEKTDTISSFQLAIEISKIDGLNFNNSLYIKNLTLLSQDSLVKDSVKSDLTIENGFGDSFNGSIQKMRIYNRVLNSSEVLNNTLFEASTKSINVNKGGRLIYK